MIQQTDDHPSVAQLRQLSTLEACTADQLEALARDTAIWRGRPGDELLARGDTDDRVLYLLDGEVELIADDGAVKRLRHGDNAAQAPIARLRPSRYQVRALSRVQFVRLPAPDNGSASAAGRDSGLEHYEVVEEASLGDVEFEYHLSALIYEDLNADRLLLPSLPDVAIKVGQVVADEDGDSRKVATVVESDPVMTTKLLKAANSPLYGGRVPVKTLVDAIVRLGMQTTHHLVITFALRELFRSQSKVLQSRMAGLWEHSCQVAALCHVLAQRNGRLDSELALLAGLTHDIGAVVIVAYAQEVDDLSVDPEALDEAINQLRAKIGSLLLRKWRLPEELAQAAADAHHWERDAPGDPDYSDLVNTALLLSYSTTAYAEQLPAVEALPASHKFGIGAGEGLSGADLLAEAAREIEESREILGL